MRFCRIGTRIMFNVGAEALAIDRAVEASTPSAVMPARFRFQDYTIAELKHAAPSMSLDARRHLARFAPPLDE